MCVYMCVSCNSNLDTLPIQLHRPLSEIDPDRCLGVFQEGPSTESIGETRFPHVGVSDDDNLKYPRLRRVIVVMRGELQRLILTENDVKFLPGFVFYCHRSWSRCLIANATEVSRECEKLLDVELFKRHRFMLTLENYCRRFLHILM